MKEKEVTLKLVEEDKYKNMSFKEVFLMNAKRFFKGRECEKTFIKEDEIKNKKSKLLAR